jgi:hypothetical protein
LALFALLLTASGDPNSDNIILTALSYSDVFKPQGISAVKSIGYLNVPNSQRVRNFMLQETRDGKIVIANVRTTTSSLRLILLIVVIIFANGK